MKLKTGLEFELFKLCCEQKQEIRIVIMLDGFDEISLSYKETVRVLLQALRQTAIEQLCVNTRPPLREGLEGKLQQLSYILETSSEENLFALILKFWCQKDWFTEVGNGVEEEFKAKSEIYTKHLKRIYSNQLVTETNNSPASHYSVACWQRLVIKNIKHFIILMNLCMSYRLS
jgi:hypothetical protein